MEDANKLISALKVLKENCKKYDNCTECPFGTNYSDCLIQESIPAGWDIQETPVMKIILR
ncbi:hypothetical protein NSA27_02415 [Clostridium tepidum]|uniref:hypothetical protein n=1 Tax=Clostridium tepidum TaxID=1962263 RepID=UPI00214A656D|nr:hypothetical protein [Clostridium tepidum]MCR1933556.1 hypothetical protein [Clostridium tepidum]